MKNYTLPIIVILVLAAAAAGFFIFSPADTREGAEFGTPSGTPSGTTSDTASGQSEQSDLEKLGPIALTDYNGNAVSLADFRGTPLILNAWATWCPFCKQELPDFAALQEEFPAIKVVAIDRQESLRQAKGYTDDINITERMTFLLDPGDDFYRSIGGFSMPETIFVNASGTIAFHKRGPMTLSEMRAFVTQHLQ